MTGFSYAVRKREQRGEPIEGQWLRAKKFVDDFHEYTFKLQNPDGSFSTEWFVDAGRLRRPSAAACRPPATSPNGWRTRSARTSSSSRG